MKVDTLLVMSDSSLTAGSLNAREHRSSALRRVVMPLLVVIVAGAIMFWGWQSGESDLREVQDAVRSMAQDIFYAPADGPLPDKARQMGVTRPIADRIHHIFDNANWDQVRIDVHTGDTPPPFGDGRATHHAVIFINHQPQLGLRLTHLGDSDLVQVLGYWVPDAAGIP